jgi:hypothetical protein
MRKKRELPKVQALYRETRELCLLYLQEVIIRPYVSVLGEDHADYVQHVVDISQSKNQILEIIILIDFITQASESPFLSLKKRIEEDAKLSETVSYRVFQEHIHKYLEYFHPNFNLNINLECLSPAYESEQQRHSIGLWK